jgi:hypothetical protein
MHIAMKKLLKLKAPRRDNTMPPKPFTQTPVQPRTIRPPWKQWKMMTCPHCLDEFELGKTGTICGCDRCEGITRDASGLIIPDPFAEIFITKTEPGDTQS